MWGADPDLVRSAIDPAYQRAFEWATFVCSGAAAAMLRQRYKLLRAIAASGMLALFVLAVELLIVRPRIVALEPALYGYAAFLFYCVLVLIYCLFSYTVFKLYERTSSIFKALVVTTVIFYFVVALFVGLLVAAMLYFGG
jgi:hypothetical protein